MLNPAEVDDPRPILTAKATYVAIYVGRMGCPTRKIGHPTGPTPCPDETVLVAWQGLKPPHKADYVDNLGVFHPPAHPRLGCLFM